MAAGEPTTENRSDAPRAWVLVAGSGVRVREEEERASERLGRLLAREGYGLLAGTWAGVDEIVTRAFCEECPTARQPHRIIHIENSPPHSSHDVRIGQVLSSSPKEGFCREAVRVADVGVVVGGRAGSKPSMDALARRGVPIVPFAWLLSDALESLLDELRDLTRRPSDLRAHRAMLLQLIDPACEIDETVSRILGGVTARGRDVFVSYHRADTGAYAGRVAAELSELYGRRRVFVDYAALAPAARIDSVLDEAGAARMLIALIGPSWAERVQRDDDYVRREIEAAIAARAVVVPIVVGTSLPKRDEIPQPLRALVDVRAVFLDNDNWDSSLSRVTTAVDAALGVTWMLAPRERARRGIWPRSS